MSEPMDWKPGDRLPEPPEGVKAGGVVSDGGQAVSNGGEFRSVSPGIAEPGSADEEIPVYRARGGLLAAAAGILQVQQAILQSRASYHVPRPADLRQLEHAMGELENAWRRISAVAVGLK